MLFGNGKGEAELRQLASDLGLGSVIVFAGHRWDLPRWMGNLDLLVHPATMEGMGVALLQASSAGVPIVASEAGGIGEAVRDGINGVLVPPADVVALRMAIRALMDDEDLLYITNFKTLKTPKNYQVDVFRTDFLVGSFTFSTNK